MYLYFCYFVVKYNYKNLFHVSCYMPHDLTMEKYKKSFSLMMAFFAVIIITIASFLFFAPVINAF